MFQARNEFFELAKQIRKSKKRTKERVTKVRKKKEKDKKKERKKKQKKKNVSNFARSPTLISTGYKSNNRKNLSSKLEYVRLCPFYSHLKRHFKN
jgi:hypothetical protein